MNMLWGVLSAVLLFSLDIHAQSCKEPLVAKRLLADDVRYASPFYVIALPRNGETEQMDNVCYSYFENGDNFFHIMSITYKNGTNRFYTYTKGDLSNRMGLAVGSGVLDSQCLFHDYTLTPICGSTVFVLYRCFIEGNCKSNIDIGITPGVDVRLVLAANPKVSQECRTETETNLRDTTILDGGDYVILPQLLAPQCITKYNNTDSIGSDRAVGSKQITENELAERFGGFSDDQGAISSNTVTQPPPQTYKPTYAPVSSTSQVVNNAPWPVYNTPPTNKQPYNPYGSSVKTSGTRPGYTPNQVWSTPASTWPVNNGQWTQGPNHWNHGHGPETHHHVWQSQLPAIQTKTTVGANPNVIYHVHSWANSPSGCCKCN